MLNERPIFTIGHSTHTIDVFLGLLKLHQIDAIADVRSAPYSRMTPHFNREALRPVLEKTGIQYVFVGDTLGGRSSDESDYEDNRVVYARLRQKPGFETGLDRVISGSNRFRIALMCSEREPMDCHRFLLIGNELSKRKVEVIHLLADSSTEPHFQTMLRLLRKFDLDRDDLFRTNEEILNEALIRQEQKVAFTLDNPQSGRLGHGRLGSNELWEDS